MFSLLPVRLLLLPVLLPQALSVRRRAQHLPEAAGPRAGVTGRGPMLRLLIIGDSAGAGVGVPTQDQALTGRLVAVLARDFTVHWRLEAQSGFTSADVLARLHALEPGPVDVAVTVVGVNDVVRQVSPRRFRRTQRAIAALLLERGAKQIWRSGLPPMEEFPLLPRPLRNVLGARARALDSVLAADSHGPLYRLPYDSTHVNSSLMAADGFHPGPAIYADWARRQAREIRQRA